MLRYGTTRHQLADVGVRVQIENDRVTVKMRSIEEHNYGEIEGHLLVGPPGTLVRIHLQGHSDKNDESVVELKRRIPEERTWRIAFSPSGKSVAVASKRGATVWGINDRKVRRLPARCWSVAYSPDERFLAIDDTTRIVLWDLEHDGLHAELDRGQRGRPMELRMESGASLAFFHQREPTLPPVQVPLFNHAPKRSDLMAWDTSQLKETKAGAVPGKRLLENGTVLTALNFTPDEKSLVAVDHDGVLRVWDTTSLQHVCDLGRPASAMNISKDGRTLAIGFRRSPGNGSGIILWDFDDRSERCTLSTDTPWGIAFSPNGKTLASASSQDVCLWDVRSGRQL